MSDFRNDLITQFALKFADDYDPAECAAAAIRYADAVVGEMVKTCKVDSAEVLTAPSRPIINPLWGLVEDWMVDGRADYIKMCSKQLQDTLNQMGIPKITCPNP